MRLWSIHPRYLDRQGLLAVWREGLLAQATLLKGEYSKCKECLVAELNPEMGIFACDKCKGTGKIKTPYWSHPQLERFKNSNRIMAIICYLWEIYNEACDRGYKFDGNKIRGISTPIQIPVTKGQLEYEFNHLQRKLIHRDTKKYYDNLELKHKYLETSYPWITPHPLFKIIEGDIESWEKITEKSTTDL